MDFGKERDENGGVRESDAWKQIKKNIKLILRTNVNMFNLYVSIH